MALGGQSRACRFRSVRVFGFLPGKMSICCAVAAARSFICLATASTASCGSGHGSRGGERAVLPRAAAAAAAAARSSELALPCRNIGDGSCAIDDDDDDELGESAKCDQSVSPPIARAIALEMRPVAHTHIHAMYVDTSTACQFRPRLICRGTSSNKCRTRGNVTTRFIIVTITSKEKRKRIK